MWKEKLNEIAQEERFYGEQINQGITEKELRVFSKTRLLHFLRCNKLANAGEI